MTQLTKTAKDTIRMIVDRGKLPTHLVHTLVAKELRLAKLVRTELGRYVPTAEAFRLLGVEDPGGTRVEVSGSTADLLSEAIHQAKPRLVAALEKAEGEHEWLDALPGKAASIPAAIPEPAFLRDRPGTWAVLLRLPRKNKSTGGTSHSYARHRFGRLGYEFSRRTDRATNETIICGRYVGDKK